MVTRDAALCERMKLYRCHDVKSCRYWHDVAGHNFRLTNLQAELDCAELEQLDSIMAEQRRVYAGDFQCFTAVEGIARQQITADVEPLMWAVAVKLDRGHYHRGGTS